MQGDEDNKEFFLSVEAGEILGSEGRLYKRNTIAIAAAVFAVGLFPGATLNGSAVPFTGGIPNTSLLIIMMALLAYNAGLLWYHNVQDFRTYLARLSSLHCGQPGVLFKGETYSFGVTHLKGSYSTQITLEETNPDENAQEIEAPRFQHEILRAEDVNGKRVIERRRPEGNTRWEHVNQGPYIDTFNFKHLVSKVQKYWAVDVCWPIILVIASLPFAVCEYRSLSDVTQPAASSLLIASDLAVT